jgi:uncharacterized protein (TIRG00374 family)
MEFSKFLPLTGIAIFIAVLLSVNLPETANYITGADPVLLVLAVLLNIPVVLMKAGKWKAVTHAHGRGVPLSECVHAWVVGFVIGIATPGRIGELSKAYYLRERMPLGRGLATIAVDRMIDILVLFTLAILGTFLFVYAYSGFLRIDFLSMLLLSFSAFISLAFFFLTRGNAVKRFAGPLFRRVVPAKYRSRMRITFHDFYMGLKDIRKGWRLVALCLATSMLSWSVIILQYKLVSMALYLQIDYLFLLSVMPVVALLDILPISFSGLGTREVALIFFLGIISVPVESVVSFSVLIFLLGYLTFVPFGLLFWFMKPIRIRL